MPRDRETFYPGETVVVEATVRDKTGALANANTATVTIYNPRKTAAITNQAMTNVSTGLYEYGYTIPTTPIKGKWKVIMTTSTSSRTVIETDYFTVDDI